MIQLKKISKINILVFVILFTSTNVFCQTVDLNTHFSGTPPTGTILEWHNATPVSAANLMTPAQVAVAPVGSYYAVFYDAVFDCYSPESIFVVPPDPCDSIASGNTDTDGDGVSDICDLDNDNDGILDAIENPCTLAPSGSWSNSGTTMTGAVSSTNIIITPTVVSGDTDIYTITNGTFNTTNFWSDPAIAGSGSLQFRHRWDSTPESGTSSENDAGVITVTINFSQPLYKLNLNIDRLGGAGSVGGNYMSNSSEWTLTTPNVVMEKLSGNNQLIVSNDKFYRDAYVDLGTTNPGGTANNTTGAAAGTIRFNRMDSSPITSLTFSLTGIGTEGSGRDEIELIFELCNAIDTDGDTIVNYLDLDSDADGCADAIEGDGTFTISDLSTSTLAGGSTNVQDNLGITVDTDGIPTISGSPQGIGSSQNISIDACAPPTLTCSVGSYDISTSVFADILDLNAFTSDVRGMDFNNDGTKLFVIKAQGGAEILEFDLPIQYDISTAIYVDNLDISSQDNIPRDLIFNNDGTKLYLLGTTIDAVYQYDLSVAYDISTGVYGGNFFSFTTQENDPFGMAFNNDGTKFYISGNQGDDINEYNLSVAYDVSTATYVDNFSVAAQLIDATRGMDFNSNGTKLFVTGGVTDNVNEYNLSVPYDVSTGIFVTSFDVSPQETAPESIAFNHNGSRMYIVGNVGNDITEYGLDSVDNYPEVTENDGSLDNANPLSLYLTGGDTFADLGGGTLTALQATVDNLPAGLTAVFTIDGPKQITLTITGNATDHQNADDIANLTYTFTDAAFTNYIGANISLSACNVGIDFVDNPPPTLICDIGDFDISTGVFANSFDVSIEENGGRDMLFNNDGTKLYIIGTTNDNINEYNLSIAYNVSTGTYVDSFSVLSQDTASRGMAFNGDGTKMYMIGITFDAIFEYSLSVAYDISTGISVDNFYVGSQESNPESMAFNNDGTKLYVIGSVSDAVNEYNLSIPYDVSTGVYVDNFSVATQEANPRGMAFNNDGSKLYITGTASDAILEYDLLTPFDVSTGTYVDSLDISTQDTLPTGITFNKDGSKVYIIGNDTDVVYEYDLATMDDYLEVVANDGSIVNSESLGIYLIDRTFVDLGSGSLDATQVTFDNLPAGLTAVFTIDNPTHITLTITGNATNHQDADDVANLAYTFTTTAFASYFGADVSFSACNVGIDFQDNEKDYMRHGKFFKSGNEQSMEFGK